MLESNHFTCIGDHIHEIISEIRSKFCCFNFSKKLLKILNSQIKMSVSLQNPMSSKCLPRSKAFSVAFCRQLLRSAAAATAAVRLYRCNKLCRSTCTLLKTFIFVTRN